MDEGRQWPLHYVWNQVLTVIVFFAAGLLRIACFRAGKYAPKDLRRRADPSGAISGKVSTMQRSTFLTSAAASAAPKTLQ